MSVFKHTFSFSQANLIKPIHYKKKKQKKKKTKKQNRRLLDSAIISKTNHIKQRPSLYQISPYQTERKQNQNRKGIGEKRFSLCATILL